MEAAAVDRHRWHSHHKRTSIQPVISYGREMSGQVMDFRDQQLGGERPLGDRRVEVAETVNTSGETRCPWEKGEKLIPVTSALRSCNCLCELNRIERVDICLPESFSTALGRGLGFRDCSRNGSLMPRKVRKKTANTVTDMESCRDKFIVGSL
jgi:hypothetical protein